MSFLQHELNVRRTISQPQEEQQRFEALFEWARQNGATGLENVRLAHFDKGGHSVRGLAAAKDLDEDVQILLPKSILLHDEHPLVQKSPMKDMGNHYLSRHHYPIKLILYLAVEGRKVSADQNKNKSFWGPVIQMMPTREEYASFYPKYASNELLQKFSVLPSVATIKDEKQELVKVWKKHRSEWVKLAKEAGVDGLTFQDFKWADTALKTRVYMTDLGVMLIPISDLANTGPKKTLAWKQDLGDDDIFKITVPEHLAKGTELLEMYHETPNDEMFRIYGFMMDDNPVPVDPLSSDECAQLEEPLSLDASKQPQPIILSGLQALAREHCPDGTKGGKSKGSNDKMVSDPVQDS